MERERLERQEMFNEKKKKEKKRQIKQNVLFVTARKMGF